MPDDTSSDSERTLPAATIGWVLTVVWLVFAGSWLVDHPSKVFEMKAGEFGDLATGAFGPLAFLWLVIGYYLQREELRLQRQEIELQRKEMSRSTQQLRNQARSIRENELHSRRDTFMRYLEIVKKQMANYSLHLYINCHQEQYIKFSDLWTSVGEVNRNLVIADSEYAFFVFYQQISIDNRVGRLVAKYNENQEIRNSVDQFVRSFDDVTGLAGQLDDDGIIVSAIENSYLGRSVRKVREIIPAP